MKKGPAKLEDSFQGEWEKDFLFNKFPIAKRFLSCAIVLSGECDQNIKQIPKCHFKVISYAQWIAENLCHDGISLKIGAKTTAFHIKTYQ